MPETRRAAKRRKVQESPLLGGPNSPPNIHLTPSVVHVILEYLDFASLVNVGACNTALQRTVYDDATVNHWKVLDFGAIRPEWSHRITDFQLSALLRRVNAREKCRTLRLGGCLQIQGSGLTPLRGSYALKEIDLRLIVPEDSVDNAFGHVEVDYDVVLPILESMAPFPSAYQGVDDVSQRPIGLSLVNFHRENPGADNQYLAYPERLADWLRSYHEVLRERMIECRTCCAFCKSAITDSHSYEDMWIAAQSAYCEVCSEYTCHPCRLTQRCHHCFFQCCQSYEAEDEKHKNIYMCDACGSNLCEDCGGTGGMCFSNNDCGMFKNLCEECAESCLETCAFCVNHDENTFCKECYDEHKDSCYDNAKNWLLQHRNMSDTTENS